MNTRMCAALMLLAAGAARADQQIELITGERLLAVIVDRTDEALIVDHPVLGRIEVPRAGVRAVHEQSPAEEAAPAPTPTPSPRPAVGATPVHAPAVPPPPHEPEGPPGVEWTTQVEFGSSVRSGNTDRTDVRVALLSVVRTPTEDEYRFDSSYYLASRGNERTDNRFTAGFLADWPLPESPWFHFAQARFDIDEFQSWDRRATGGGGLGYRLIGITGFDDAGALIDLFKLRVRFGAGGSKEWGSENEDLQPEGILGGELYWRLSRSQYLAANSTYFPNLENTSEFRAVSNIEWVLELNQLDGISFKLGLTHEYQSLVDPGIDPNDLYVFGSLVVNF